MDWLKKLKNLSIIEYFLNDTLGMLFFLLMLTQIVAAVATHNKYTKEPILKHTQLFLVLLFLFLFS